MARNVTLQVVASELRHDTVSLPRRPSLESSSQWRRHWPIGNEGP